MRAGIHGIPASVVSFENATAPIAANVTWHRATCPEVRTSRPRDSAYQDEFRRWVREAKFDLDRINASTRSRLMTLFEHRADVEAWRATLTPAQRVARSGPEVVLRRWRESQRESHVAADGTKFDFVLYEPT